MWMVLFAGLSGGRTAGRSTTERFGGARLLAVRTQGRRRTPQHERVDPAAKDGEQGFGVQLVAALVQVHVPRPVELLVVHLDVVLVDGLGDAAPVEPAERDL